LQVLYQIDFTKQPSRAILPLYAAHFRSNKILDDYAVRLVEGVEGNRGEIDHILREYSEHWALERMSRVDRTILRIAVFELLWCPDIPPKVSINEAIELGKKFSTDKSAVFINGILDKIAHTRSSD
jgi:transcription antitermination protein NusB